MTDPDHSPGAGWMPTSPCSALCAAVGPHTGGLRSAYRAAVRSIMIVLVLLTAAVTAPLLVLLTPQARAGWLRATSRAALAAAGVAIRVHGSRDTTRVFGHGGVLVVANHLSWIEVLAMCSVAPVRLIAKREICGWPVVGAIASATGTLFIDRRRLRQLPDAVADMATALRAGDAVAVFPEGTTWCGAAAGPFRRAAFQAALDAGVPVRPVAVVLRRSGRIAHEAAFVGEQSLLSSLIWVLRLSAVVCELTLLPAITPDGDRAQLASRAGAAIAGSTGVGHPTRPRSAVHPSTAASSPDEIGAEEPARLRQRGAMQAMACVGHDAATGDTSASGPDAEEVGPAPVGQQVPRLQAPVEEQEGHHRPGGVHDRHVREPHPRRTATHPTMPRPGVRPTPAITDRCSLIRDLSISSGCSSRDRDARTDRRPGPALDNQRKVRPRRDGAYATSASTPPVTATSSAHVLGNTACANCSI